MSERSTRIGKFTTPTRIAATTAIALLGSTMLGGCVYRTVETQVPAASPATTTTVVVTSPAGRVVTYPAGRYELYGDGVSTQYYWVWIPAGTTLPAPPPPPKHPQITENAGGGHRSPFTTRPSPTAPLSALKCSPRAPSRSSRSESEETNTKPVSKHPNHA